MTSEAGHRQHRHDPLGPEADRGLDRDVLQDPAIHVDVVGQRPGREHHRDARGGEDALDEVDRPGATPGHGGDGVLLDQGAVLGHVAQQSHAERGHRQPELQARAGDQGGVDRQDPARSADAQRPGERIEREHRPRVAPEPAPRPRQVADGAGETRRQIQ